MKCPAEIKAHDRHPGEHGHGDEVAKVAQKDTFGGFGVQRDVENKNEIEGHQKDADDIAHSDLAMEVLELWDGHVDSECYDEEDETNAAAPRVDILIDFSNAGNGSSLISDLRYLTFQD